MKKSTNVFRTSNSRINNFFSSYQNRVKVLAAATTIIALSFAIIVFYSGINYLYSKSSAQTKKGLAVVNEEYLNNYINTTSQLVHFQTQHFLNDKVMLEDVYPKVIGDEKKINDSNNTDIEISEILNYVENLKLAKTGFAYITQANGNVLAVNKSGEKAFGLKSTVEYSRVQRLLGNSRYNSVKEIKLPVNDKISKKYIEIDGKEYMIVQKNLLPLTIWNKDKGFYKENWTLGFVVPKKELFEPYYDLRDQMNKIKTEILIKQLVITFFIIMILGISLSLLSKRMNRELIKLENATEEIINGNYDLNLDVDIKSNVEVHKLAVAINKMTSEIKSNFTKLRLQNELLKVEINSRKSKEILINYLENYDTLTKLPKENILIKNLEERISFASGTIMMIGIDDFRRVNEVIGHEGGNEVLKMFSQRLKTISKEASLVSRLNGDEFVVLYDNITNFDDIIIKAEEIMNTMKDMFLVNNKEIYITESIGISIFPSDSSDSCEIIKYASAALSRAKEVGRGKYIFYDAEINKNNEKRIDLIKNMRYAIANNEFEVYYQPQVDTKTKKIIGMEALIRWNSKELGVVGPGSFIPLLEETGMILEVGKWIIQTACSQTRKIHDLGYQNLIVAVNISPIQFYQSDIVYLIEKVLEETGLLPKYLELEVTENIFIKDIDKAIDILNKLRDKGISIAVDDFGTGYCSLSYIKKLPIDKLKIDRSFIKDIPNKDNGALANIIIKMGKSFDLKILAEGVETIEQNDYLIKKKCNQIQGYLYSKPVAFKEFIKKLEDEL